VEGGGLVGSDKDGEGVDGAVEWGLCRSVGGWKGRGVGVGHRWGDRTEAGCVGPPSLSPFYSASRKKSRRRRAQRFTFNDTRD